MTGLTMLAEAMTGLTILAEAMTGLTILACGLGCRESVLHQPAAHMGSFLLHLLQFGNA